MYRSLRPNYTTFKLLTVNRVAQQNSRPSNGLIISFAYVPIKIRYVKKTSICFPFHRSNSDEYAVALRRILLQAMTCHSIENDKQFCFVFFFFFLFIVWLILFSNAKANFSIEIECAMDAHDLQKSHWNDGFILQNYFYCHGMPSKFSWKRKRVRACKRVTQIIRTQFCVR